MNAKPTGRQILAFIMLLIVVWLLATETTPQPPKRARVRRKPQHKADISYVDFREQKRG